MAEGMKTIFSRFSIYDAITKNASLANYIPDKWLNNKTLNPWSIGHTTPTVAKMPFHVIFKKAMKELKEEKCKNQ